MVELAGKDLVVRDGCYVTVQVGGIRATRLYGDSWQAKRAESQLLESEKGRLNFFRRLKRSPR